MAQEEQATEDAKETSSSKPGKMLLIGALLGSLVLGGVGGAFALGPVLAKKFAAPKSAEAATTEEKGDEGHGSEGSEKKAESTVHVLENLVLNPAGSNGTRFLMAAGAAEVKDENVKTEM